MTADKSINAQDTVSFMKGITKNTNYVLNGENKGKDKMENKLTNWLWKGYK